MHFLKMSCLLMQLAPLNVNTCTDGNTFLEDLFQANKVNFGVNEIDPL